MKLKYWLDLIGKAEILPENRLLDLKQECSELVVILTTICKKTKGQTKITPFFTLQTLNFYSEIYA